MHGCTSSTFFLTRIDWRKSSIRNLLFHDIHRSNWFRCRESVVETASNESVRNCGEPCASDLHFEDDGSTSLQRAHCDDQEEGDQVGDDEERQLGERAEVSEDPACV